MGLDQPPVEWGFGGHALDIEKKRSQTGHAQDGLGSARLHGGPVYGKAVRRYGGPDTTDRHGIFPQLHGHVAHLVWIGVGGFEIASGGHMLAQAPPFARALPGIVERLHAHETLTDAHDADCRYRLRAGEPESGDRSVGAVLAP